mmetsp:Transcript_3424/g.10577  ORF Transcript_3424/g.10577 Transcript_3424/m.10577 type:complete len:219 (-) Transcript_3424:144-800(-)
MEETRGCRRCLGALRGLGRPRGPWRRHCSPQSAASAPKAGGSTASTIARDAGVTQRRDWELPCIPDGGVENKGFGAAVGQHCRDPPRVQLVQRGAVLRVRRGERGHHSMVLQPLQQLRQLRALLEGVHPGLPRPCRLGRGELKEGHPVLEENSGDVPAAERTVIGRGPRGGPQLPPDTRVVRAPRPRHDAVNQPRAVLGTRGAAGRRACSWRVGGSAE